MAPHATNLSRHKRKATRSASPEDLLAPSDDEFGGGLLEGILSQSEDGSDDDGDDLLGEEDVASDSEDDVDVQDREAVKTPEIPDTSLVRRIDQDDDEDRPNYTVVTDVDGHERYVYDEIVPVYDSDDSDAVEPANTIGNISLSFYDSYPHIGYDINGKRIMRPAKGEALDALLDSIDIPKGWTGLTDPETGKPLNLSREELEVLKKIQTNEIPEEGYNPYPVRVIFTSFSSSNLSRIWLSILHRSKRSSH